MYLDLKKRVLMIITQHNLYKTTERCLKSIKEHIDLSDVNLVVIDDCSDAPEAKEWLNSIGDAVIRMDKVYHHNSIIRQVLNMIKEIDSIEYLCALNNDILVTDNWLRNMLSCMDIDKQVGIMGAKDNNEYHKYQNFPIPNDVKPEINGGFDDFGYLFGDDSKLQEYINKEFYAKRKPNAHIVTETIDGTVMLIRTSAAKQVGGFNPDYDDYAGDSAFEIRLQRAGFNVAYCLSSFVYHIGGGAGGKYQSFLKNQGRQLADACAEKKERIMTEYGIDITDYGRAIGNAVDNWKLNEQELVKI